MRTRVAVDDQLDRLDGADLGHDVVQVLLRRVVRDVAHEHGAGSIAVDLIGGHRAAVCPRPLESSFLLASLFVYFGVAESDEYLIVYQSMTLVSSPLLL